MRQDSVEPGTAFRIMQAGKLHGACVMSSAKEYRQYASECMDWAKSARQSKSATFFYRWPSHGWRPRFSPGTGKPRLYPACRPNCRATKSRDRVGSDSRYVPGGQSTSPQWSGWRRRARVQILPSHAVRVHFCERFGVPAGVDPLYGQHQSKRSRG
jgi:hypothetical protein